MQGIVIVSYCVREGAILFKQILRLHHHRRLIWVKKSLFFKNGFEEVFSDNQDKYHRNYKTYY